MIPNIVHFGASGGYPELVDPRVSRDFIYVDDVAQAFVDVGLKLSESDYGESFNIGTGRKTTIGDIVTVSQKLFDIRQDPVFTMPNREWDLTDWFADISKVRERFGWAPRIEPRRRARTHCGVVSIPARQDRIPAVVEALRTRYQAQRVGDHRLLQGRSGDTDHVRTPEKDLHQSECRSRDHLRQRLQPGRFGRGDPLHLPQ